MPFQPGNQWWKMRETHGRPGIFKTADDLREAIESYFQWNEDNPLYEDNVSFYQGVPTHEKLEKVRALTIEGLCLHIGINRQTWANWRNDSEKPDDFIGVIDWAENVMRYQKFTNAAAGLLNANIISRDLGLADKKDVQQRAVVSVDKNMTPEDAARAYQDMMNSDG